MFDRMMAMRPSDMTALETGALFVVGVAGLVLCIWLQAASVRLVDRCFAWFQRSKPTTTPDSHAVRRGVFPLLAGQREILMTPPFRPALSWSTFLPGVLLSGTIAIVLLAVLNPWLLLRIAVGTLTVAGVLVTLDAQLGDVRAGPARGAHGAEGRGGGDRREDHQWGSQV